jgi:membrane-associated phospholipid phosphatase
MLRRNIKMLQRKQKARVAKFRRAAVNASMRTLLVALFVCTAASAPAAESGPFAYDLRIDLPITAVGAAGWIVSEALKSHIVAPTCRWCDGSYGASTLNGFDATVRRNFVVSNTGAADTASNITGFALLPLASLGLDLLAAADAGHLRGSAVDVMLIIESAVFASDLNQAVKFAAARERPFVHVLSPAEKSQTAQPADNDLSFFSGHTTLVFSLAVSSGTVASMRRYRLAPLIWSLGLLLAGTTAYLRIAADRHYATDVLVGAAVGASVGFAVPYWFHRKPRRGQPRVSVGGGASVNLAWSW